MNAKIALPIWIKSDINHRINIKARLALLIGRPHLTNLMYHTLMGGDTDVHNFCDNIYRLTGRSVVALAHNEKPVRHVYLSPANIATRIEKHKEAKRKRHLVGR
jgi:hypothetical protein